MVNKSRIKDEGKSSLTLQLPLEVYVKRKKFILNLNNYRRTHYHLLNRFKTAYAGFVWAELGEQRRLALDIDPPYRFIYTLFQGNQRHVDVENPLSVISKFTNDVLQAEGLIPEDNHDVIREIVFRWGGVDVENPRADLRIEHFKEVENE